MIHKHVIKIGDKSKDTIITMIPPSNKVELQSLIRKIQYKKVHMKPLWIIESFMLLVKIKNNEEFVWGPNQ